MRFLNYVVKEFFSVIPLRVCVCALHACACLTAWVGGDGYDQAEKGVFSSLAVSLFLSVAKLCNSLEIRP